MRRMTTLVGLLAMTLASLNAAVDAVKVTTDRTVDSSSLETIVADVIRLADAKSDDEKGIALYNYMNQVLFHHAYACEKKPRSVGPLKVINVYGWGLCGGEHTVMKALFETSWPVRQCQQPSRSMSVERPSPGWSPSAARYARSDGLKKNSSGAALTQRASCADSPGSLAATPLW